MLGTCSLGPRPLSATCFIASNRSRRASSGHHYFTLADGRIAGAPRSWRGELALTVEGGAILPVAVRAEVVAARDGSVLGFFVILVDLTDSRRVADARRHHDRQVACPVAPDNVPAWATRCAVAVAAASGHRAACRQSSAAGGP